MKYRGSCHCGKLAFEVEGKVDGALRCNCSICHRKGSLLWFVPRASFRLTVSADDVATYTFNRHVIKHQFCRHCGIHTHGLGVDPKGNEMAAINLRCVEDFDFSTIPVQDFNGRAM
jgi:hypothetical protein